MKRSASYFAIVIAGLFIATIAFESFSYARAGGGRSSGSRSYRSAPSQDRSYSQQRPAQSQQQSNRGSFLKSVGGGIVGGLLGGMLFRSLGFGGGMGGGGGLLQIIIFALIGYLVYKLIRKALDKKNANPLAAPRPPVNIFGGNQADTASDSSWIHSSDPSFNETGFKDNVMDVFFKIQAAWMNRDLSSVSNIVEDKMKKDLQGDIDKLKSDKRINKLENIAVRSVDITESWQDDGYDCITVRIYATILDYTVDEFSGSVVEGSKTEPSKFEEHWTFERRSGGRDWQLAAINQI